MDTGEKYIGMCRAAEELQDIARKRKSDDCEQDYYTYMDCSKQTRPICVEIYGLIYKPYRGYSSFWLPRQDQLQKMVCGKDFLSPVDHVIEINKFITRHVDLARECDTMEQLWLCYYMLTIHRKMWDGTGWILTDNETPDTI